METSINIRGESSRRGKGTLQAKTQTRYNNSLHRWSDISMDPRNASKTRKGYNSKTKARTQYNSRAKRIQRSIYGVKGTPPRQCNRYNSRSTAHNQPSPPPLPQNVFCCSPVGIMLANKRGVVISPHKVRVACNVPQERDVVAQPLDHVL